MRVKDTENLHFPLTFGSPNADPAFVFKDIDFLKANTPDDQELSLTPEDKTWIEETVNNGRKTSPPPTLAAQRYLETQLTQYNFELPGSKGAWQNFVLTKLFEQANDLDPKVSKAALDTLARTSAVGLMEQKIDVNVVHKSSEELQDELRRAMDRYLSRNEKVISGEATRA